jgi:Microcystin-dependent protein
MATVNNLNNLFMDPLMSQILLWALNWAPQDWAACNGQALNAQQNAAMYSLLGTTYGGNSTTFLLPDFRGRVPVGYGQNPITGTNYQLGVKGGAETVTLTQDNLAAHTHVATVNASAVSVTIKASSVAGTDNVPGTNNSTTLAASMSGRSAGSFIYNNQTPTVALNTAGAITGTFGVANAATGNGAAHENRQPFLVVNFIIALVGLYPSRPD